MRKLRTQRLEVKTGQTIVLVAFGLVVVLAFAGLAIDGSNVYFQRRRVQNAADSAALSGARTLALGAATNGDVLSAIQDYVTKNVGATYSLDAQYINSTGKLGSIASYGAANPPPASAAGVYVRTGMNYPVFFGGIFGVSRKSSSAEAAAQSGSAGSVSSNAFPVALNVATLNAVNPGTTIEIWDTNQITDANGVSLANSLRGWLNFNFVYSSSDPNGRIVSNNYSNSDLKSWVGGSYTKPLYAGTIGGLNGDFINGDPGTRTSDILESSARIGAIVYLPVYDAFYDSTFMQANLSPTPALGWSGGSGGSAYFHIVGFAAFQITGTSNGYNKYIAGTFVKKVIGSSLGGSLTQSDALASVNLTDVPK